MRIVIDLQCCQTDSRKRGIGRQARSLAAALCRNSGAHEILIALSNLFPDSVQEIKEDFKAMIPASQFAVWEAPRKFQGSHEATRWRETAGEMVREDYLRSLKADVVHLASLFEGMADDALTSIPADRERTVHSTTLHDLIPFTQQELYLPNPEVRHRYLRKVSQIENAQVILAISDYSKQEGIDLLSLDPSKIHNISCAADSAFCPTKMPVDKRAALRDRFALPLPFAMYTGCAEPRKNVERLIEAFAALPDAIRMGHQLAIAGEIDPNHLKRLVVLTEALGLPPGAVVFTGYVRDEDLVALYNMCTCFVFPSWHEGFGLPVLEAMSCGAATIGSDVTSIPEVIGRKDALFDPFKVESIAGKLCEVLSDEQFRASLQAHAIQQSRRFSWDESARRALSAMEQAHGNRVGETQKTPAPASDKPLLAFVSPLPPERTGIAQYSAELLPTLARYYEIEVIVNQPAVSEPGITANFPIRTAEWFDLHAEEFDRIIYQFGNSPCHFYMLKLLERHPGVIILHDFFLSSLYAWAAESGESPGLWDEALYHSHGYDGLIGRQGRKKVDAIREFPCNKAVLDWASGVIVHSQHGKALAERWYGGGTAQSWKVVNHPRAEGQPCQRKAARERLGIASDEWVACSFGQVDATKHSLRVLRAWLASPLGKNAACRLIFVGSNAGDAYGAELLHVMKEGGVGNRIAITGYVEREIYQSYLAACDCAVQLRTNSRGESSGAVLDCLSRGVPTIINAHGAMAELPEGVVLRLDDLFTDEELACALGHLHGDANEAEAMGIRARSHVAVHYDPALCARHFRDAIEHFAASGRHGLLARMSNRLTRLSDQVSCSPEESDWRELAECIAANGNPTGSVRQIIADVTELADRNLRTGIQRVQHAILGRLLESQPSGFRVEPVYAKGGRYYRARKFTCDFLGIKEVMLEDDPLEVRPGDIFLSLDWGIETVPSVALSLQKMRNRGVKLYFLIYDLLPGLLPDCFPESVKTPYTPWLSGVTSLADGLICISRSVADELRAWIREACPDRTPQIGYFHLGSDIEAAAFPSQEAHAGTRPFPEAIHPYFLMVSTLEPRKGHGQVLDAFERLWSRGVEHNLVFVGKYGHSIDGLAARIRAHPSLNRRFFWFESLPDRNLIEVYKSATALIAASRGEGFGLPLVEAARHGVPIIARDIPVFREVAGEHAFYFAGESPVDVEQAVKDWLSLHSSGRAPESKGMPIIDWSESTRSLLGLILEGRWQQCETSAAPVG